MTAGSRPWSATAFMRSPTIEARCSTARSRTRSTSASSPMAGWCLSPTTTRACSRSPPTARSTRSRAGPMAWSGSAVTRATAGPASDALFIQLDGIAVTPDDLIYVSDSLANRVRKIQDGMITTVAGTGEPGLPATAGPANQAALHWPTALELDPTAACTSSTPSTTRSAGSAVDGTITTVVGTGVEGSGRRRRPRERGSAQPAVRRRRSTPTAASMSVTAELRVRRVGTDGIINTIAGVGVEGIGREGGPRSGPSSGSRPGSRSTATGCWSRISPTRWSGACACAEPAHGGVIPATAAASRLSPEEGPG